VSARNNAVKAKYTGTSATKAISEAPVHELSTFSVAELSASEVAVGLSEDKIDKLPEPKFIESDKTALKAARKAALVSVAQGATITTPQGTAITKDVLLKAKTADIAKYPFEALLAMADELPIPTLTKIVQDGNISKTQQKDIRYIIENFIAGSPAHADAIAYEDWLTGPLGKQLGK
jgi:hypothetical protein